MMIKELGGNSTVFDITQMREYDPSQPISIGVDGRAAQRNKDRDIGEIE